MTNEYKDEILSLSKKLFEKLYKKIEHEPKDRNHLVNLIYSGVILLQVNFEFNLVNKIGGLVVRLANHLRTGEANEKMRMQETTLILFFRALTKRGILSVNYSNLGLIEDVNYSRKIQLIFLSKEQLDLDVRLMQLKARFNPHQLIYVV